MLRQDPAADLARAIAFENAIIDRLSLEREPFEWGTALFHPDFPGIYDLNFLRVERPDDTISADLLMSEAHRLMAPRDLEHRKVAVDDAELGALLAPAFAEAGWDVTRLLIMVHRRPPQRSPTSDVEETVAAVHGAAKVRSNRESPYFDTEEGIEQMRRVDELAYEVTDKRTFAAYVDDTIASLCELYSDGLTAQIEDVATVEEYRGRGLASSVVLRALHEAQAWGHDMIFLVADDDDWPKEMYSKLGFEGVGLIYQFLLKQQSV